MALMCLYFLYTMLKKVINQWMEQFNFEMLKANNCEHMATRLSLWWKITKEKKLNWSIVFWWGV